MKVASYGSAELSFVSSLPLALATPGFFPTVHPAAGCSQISLTGGSLDLPLVATPHYSYRPIYCIEWWGVFCKDSAAP